MAQIVKQFRSQQARQAGTHSGYAAVFYNPDRSPARKKITLRTRDKAVARRRLVELEKQESLGLYDPWEDASPHWGTLLKDAVDAFSRSRTERRESTVTYDAGVLARFVEGLPASLLLAQVEERHVRRFIDAPKAGGAPRAATSRLRYHATLAVFFKWCCTSGRLDRSPMQKMTPPKAHHKERRYLEVAEYKDLTAFIETHAAENAGTLQDGQVVWLAALVHMLCQTGLRISELAGLRWSDVRLGQRSYFIVGRSTMTKSGHERTVTLTGKALDIVQARSAARSSQANDLVFTGVTGGKLNTAYVSKRIKKFAEMAGLHGTVTAHTLRHTYGAMLASAGVPPYQIKELMGHDALDTTIRFYGHLYPDAKHAAVERVFGSL